MAAETAPRTPEGTTFALAGRVTRWEPIARELTIGDRVLYVAPSVRLVGPVAVGATVVVSGYQPPDPTDRRVVTQLQVG